jgi:hypothetical protein
MDKQSTFTPAQRHALADTLKNYNGNIRDIAVDRLDRRRNDLRDSLIHGLAESKGALKMIAQIEEFREKTEQAQSALSTLGFDLDNDGDLSFSDDAPKSLVQNVQKRLDKEFGTRRDLVEKIELAAVKILTVATLDEANQIIESLVNA